MLPPVGLLAEFPEIFKVLGRLQPLAAALFPWRSVRLVAHLGVSCCGWVI